MSENFNKLSPAQAERLAWMSEELAEVQQTIGKILRHGYEVRYPFDDPQATSNREDLMKEIGDLYAAIELMRRSEDIDISTIVSHSLMKLDNCRQWFHHQAGSLFE